MAERRASLFTVWHDAYFHHDGQYMSGESNRGTTNAVFAHVILQGSEAHAQVAWNFM
jgi:hypothetical protein